MNIFQRIWNFLFKKSEPEAAPAPAPVKTNPSMGPAKPTPVPPAADGGRRFLDSKGRFLINEKVIRLTKHFEGLELVARDDGYGTPTIGYGRIKYDDGSKVRNGDRCTEAQAEKWLLTDLEREGAVYVRAFLRDDVENNLSDDEFSVWVDLTFNRGAGRFREYLSGLLNSGSRAGALGMMVGPNLTSAGGRYSLGLDRRRWAERYILEGKNWEVFKDLTSFVAFKNRGYK